MLRYINNLTCIVVLVGLTACAHNVWVKPGASQQDFATDSYECERDMRQSKYFGGGLMGQANAVSFEGKCMNARGWTLETQTAAVDDEAVTTEAAARQSASDQCVAMGIHINDDRYSTCFKAHFHVQAP